MFKVIIAGGRTFNNYQLLKYKMNQLLKNKTDIQIVSGHAKDGADALGEIYAKEMGFKLKLFPADWDNVIAPGAIIKLNSFGKEYNAKAGSDRNLQMAKYADAAVVFWNKKSKGSKDMIKSAKENGLLVRIVYY